MRDWMWLIKEVSTFFAMMVLVAECYVLMWMLVP